MRHQLREFFTAAISSTAFLFIGAALLISATPSDFVPFGSQSVFAEGKDFSEKSSSHGKSTHPNTVASAATSPNSAKAIVRQYVLETGLKQGEIARLLESWNSLERSEQAYFNNLDNQNSLPRLHIAYIRGNSIAEGALARFLMIGGSLDNLPREVETRAARLFVDQYNAWAIYRDAVQTDPFDLALDGMLADFLALGGDPINPPTEEESRAAQMHADQYDAWATYQDAETVAKETFIASVNRSSDVDDHLTYDKLHKRGDAIVELNGLVTLVSELDAGTAGN